MIHIPDIRHKAADGESRHPTDHKQPKALPLQEESSTTYSQEKTMPNNIAQFFLTGIRCEDDLSDTALYEISHS